MAKGISIGIGSDTKAFLAGIKSGVIAPLEDAEDTLKKLGDAGDRAGDKIENSVDGAESSLKSLGDSGERAAKDIEKSADDADSSLKKLGDSGKRAGEDLEDSMRGYQQETKDSDRVFREFSDTVRTESRDAARNLKTNFKEGTDGAKEGLSEFKDEANSTAKESAASFDGSAESIVGSFQEIAANAFSGFGPAGAAAGLAAAAGIGVVTSVITQQIDDSEELKAALSGAYRAAAEAGRAYLDEAEVISQVNDVLFDEDQARSKEALKNANALGVTRIEYLRAMAGDQDALNNLIGIATKKEAEGNAEREKAYEAGGRRNYVVSQEDQLISGILGKLETQKSLQSDLTQRANESLAVAGANTEEARKLTSTLAQIPRDISVTAKVQADTSAFDRTVAAIKRGGIDIPVSLRVLESFGRKTP